MLTLNSKPSQFVSKFRLRTGIILLILGLGLLAFGALSVMHTRENVLIEKDAVKRTQDKMSGLSGAPAASRSGREFQELSVRLAFYEATLSKAKGYFTQAILILTGGVLVSSVGFCLVYLHRRKMRSLTYAENGLLSV